MRERRLGCAKGDESRAMTSKTEILIEDFSREVKLLIEKKATQNDDDWRSSRAKAVSNKIELSRLQNCGKKSVFLFIGVRAALNSGWCAFMFGKKWSVERVESCHCGFEASTKLKTILTEFLSTTHENHSTIEVNNSARKGWWKLIYIFPLLTAWNSSRQSLLLVLLLRSLLCFFCVSVMRSWDSSRLVNDYFNFVFEHLKKGSHLIQLISLFFDFSRRRRRAVWNIREVIKSFIANFRSFSSAKIIIMWVRQKLTRSEPVWRSDERNTSWHDILQTEYVKWIQHNISWDDVGEEGKETSILSPSKKPFRCMFNIWFGMWKKSGKREKRREDCTKQRRRQRRKKCNLNWSLVDNCELWRRISNSFYFASLRAMNAIFCCFSNETCWLIGCALHISVNWTAYGSRLRVEISCGWFVRPYNSASRRSWKINSSHPQMHMHRLCYTP